MKLKSMNRSTWNRMKKKINAVFKKMGEGRFYKTNFFLLLSFGLFYFS